MRSISKILVEQTIAFKEQMCYNWSDDFNFLGFRKKEIRVWLFRI